MNNLFNIQYDIPRVNVQMPGRQNRIADGNITVIPSMTHPIQFRLGNMDGVPINLLPFEIHFIVWAANLLTNKGLSVGQSDLILNKVVKTDDPYSGTFEMVLTETDTLSLAKFSGDTLCWSLALKNNDGQIFPMKVSINNGHIGYLYVETAHSFPIAEFIRSSVTK